MSFPNFSGKHAHDAFVTPQDYVAYLRRLGRLPEVPMPAGVILCYQRYPLRYIQEHEEVERVGGFPGEFYILPVTGGAVGVCGGFGIGAPAATTVLEECVALGARRFISIGTAGTLQPAVRVGDIVVCDRAVRDEGVSHHYLPPEKYAYPSNALTRALRARLTRRGAEPVVGAAWTIDAPYRETVEEARHYRDEGVLTVDMEASALFAVARYRGVALASAFVVSDSLAELVWDPRFDAEAVEAGFDHLYHAARDVLWHDHRDGHDPSS